MSLLRAWYSIQPRALRLLVTANVCIYVLWVLALSHIGVTSTFVTEHLAFTAAWPGFVYEPWQLFTYSFLHLGPGFIGLLHLVLNMLWLYWLGYDVEDLYGPHALLSQYLVTAAGGAILSAIVYNLIGTPQILIHGASGAVLGTITALAVRQPHKRIAVWPVGSLRLTHLVIAFLALDLLILYGSGVAVFAHLGGALTGLAYAMVESRGVDLSSWAKVLFPPRRRMRPDLLHRLERRLAGASSRERSPGVARAVAPQHKRPVEEELDVILDKINEEGLDALSPAERAVLESFSRNR